MENLLHPSGFWVSLLLDKTTSWLEDAMSLGKYLKWNGSFFEQLFVPGKCFKLRGSRD